MSLKVSYDLSPMEKKFGPGNIKNARIMVANQVVIEEELDTKITVAPFGGRYMLEHNSMVQMESLDSENIQPLVLVANGLKKLLIAR